MILDPATGLHYRPSCTRDSAALAQIKRYAPDEIASAAAKAKSGDDLGRAFPSAVLRLLRRSRGVAAHDDAPAWARGGLDHDRRGHGDLEEL